jgi:hypothetical protein
VLEFIRVRLEVNLLGASVLELPSDERVVITDGDVRARDAHHGRIGFVLLLFRELVYLGRPDLSIIVHAVVKESILFGAGDDKVGSARSEAKAIHHFIGLSKIRVGATPTEDSSGIVVAIELFWVCILLELDDVLQLVLHWETLVKNKGIFIHLWLLWRYLMILRLINHGLSDGWGIAMILLVLMHIGVHAWRACLGLFLPQALDGAR